MKQKKIFIASSILLGLGGIVIANPIIIANQKPDNSTNLKTANEYDLFNKNNLVQIKQNESQLLKEITNKFDDTKLEFFSFNSNKVYLTNEIKKLTIKEWSKSKKIIDFVTYSRCVYCSNWEPNHSPSCPKYKPSNGNNNSSTDHEHIRINRFPNIPLRTQVDEQLKNKFTEKTLISEYEKLNALSYHFSYPYQLVCSKGLLCTINMTGGDRNGFIFVFRFNSKIYSKYWWKD